MGGAVLNGLLKTAFSAQTEPTKKPISRFILCTKTAASATRLEASLAPEHQKLTKVVSGQNLQTMQDADIIILGCKPFMAADVLGEEGVREALAGKLVISMLGGQSAEKLVRLVNPEPGTSPDPHVIVAVPTMGAEFCQSMTIIETPPATVPAVMAETAEWIFKQVGAVKFFAAEQVGLATVLIGASMATLTLPIEGLLDGCVAEGLKRGEAMELILQGLKGLTAVLESGQHPGPVRESICSPRGCTIQTLLGLEKAGTRGHFAEALIKGHTHLKEKM